MQTRFGRNSIESVDLFDETVGYDNEPSARLARGLSEYERRVASILYNLFTELWGVCIVVGDPGKGKDLFGNWLSYVIKRFFPWKRILRDEKPRRLFGEYAGLFNESVLQEDLAKMKVLATGKTLKEKDEVLEKAADAWVTEVGEVLLKNSVLYLTEYWRYCYNREPMNPMNKTMGGIHRMKRHLDVFIIGTVQNPTELDKKTCLKYVDWRVTCTRSRVNITGFTYLVQKVKYDPRMDMLVSLSKAYPIPVDGGKPQSFIGDGKIVVKKYDYSPETEEERVVLEVLKAGISNYEELVELLETKGDMSEWETLSTLKELGLKLPNKKPKFVIDYPCYYKIFNSKSAPQIRTSLKVEA